ncbi:MAG TPA: hypothetical protein PLD27_11745 [bacterium]|nr:hypothetical protein [bacterium]
MKREKGFMSEELFRKIADECIENNVALRLIGLGEPFLHIIRYRTYDIGVKSKICCQLNSAYLSLKEIKGRIQDFAINRDGLRVPVAPGLFDYHIDWSGVKQFQIVQKQKGILQLKISLNEKSENEFNKISTRLLNDLYIVFGEQFIFNISYCDRIENTSRGKFRYFIQEMK